MNEAVYAVRSPNAACGAAALWHSWPPICAKRKHVGIYIYSTRLKKSPKNERYDGDRAVREAKQFGIGTSGRKIANPQFYTNMRPPHGQIEDSRNLILDQIRYPADFVHFHEGFFDEVLPTIAPVVGDLALIRLDDDWYASTKVCLEHLYPHVTTRGIISIDDYGAYEGCRLSVDEFFASQGITPYLWHVDEENVFFIKPPTGYRLPCLTDVHPRRYRILELEANILPLRLLVLSPRCPGVWPARTSTAARHYKD